ncbi:glycosyltransferase [Lutibacter sp. TH_r2]|nr:glycosyltransferase [Lutibacter sp. TH_r2]
MLQKEFPTLKNYQLSSYNIKYAKQRNTLKLKLFLSIPSVLKAVREEKKQVAKIVEKELLSGIISDNRFGVFSSKIPSVYITHQLNVLSGITTYFTSKIHQNIALKFTEIWIPDIERENNFSGKLSEILHLKSKTKFIGVLSRFKFEEKPKKYDITVVLSGIEPQRSLLEKKLLKELKNTSKKVMFVRGKLTSEVLHASKNIEVVNFLTSEELNSILNKSELVIARSGYSTIMDLAVLGKKAFFIPTPDQNEQEYLAERIHNLNIAPFCKQEQFTFKKLNEVENYNGFNKLDCKLNIEFFSLFQGK